MPVNLDIFYREIVAKEPRYGSVAVMLTGEASPEIRAVSSVLLPISVYQNASGSFLPTTTYQNASGTFLPTTVFQTASTDFAPSNIYQSLTSNWETAYNQSLTLNQYLPLSGGDVTGDLTITGNISGFNTRVFFNAGIATGFRSFATNTGQATGSNSFAEGNNTSARGSSSHAEGLNSIASGTGSHAEGNATIASGIYAHSQGSNAEAAGLISHAMGSRTKALGEYAFAGGRRAVAKDNYSYVWATETGSFEVSSTRIGQYLVSASGGMYIPSNVGIGTDSIDNALTVVGTISTSSHGDSNLWNTAYNIATTYQTASSSFATNTLLQSTSALLTPLTLTNTLTGQLVTNAAFTNYQTSVAASTATLLPTSIYQDVSGNWQSTFAIVSALSASWEESADIIPTVTNYLSGNNTAIINDAVIFENLGVGALTVTHPDSRIAGRYAIDRLIGTGELIYRNISNTSVYIGRLFSPLGWMFYGLNAAVFGSGYFTTATYPWGNNLESGSVTWSKVPIPPFAPDPVPTIGLGGLGSIKKIDLLGSFRSVSTIQSLSTVIAQGGNSDQWNRSFNTSTAYQNISSSFLLQGGNSLSQTLSVGTSDNQHLVLETNSVNRMTILSSGNVGIGTSNPTNPLTVQGSVSATTYFGDGSNLTGINFTLSSNNTTLSTVTLNPIAVLSGTNFITSRVLQDKLGEVISVKDFGARGDGVSNDWLSIQRALSAAAGIARVYIPQGLYFISQELRIPSNSYIYGAGIGTTIIKLSSTANATQCVMTNSQNTRSVATNQGNENITIKDLELDGNVSRFPGSYSPVGDASGTGLCFAYVKNALVERVSVHDTCRHCFDIGAPETSITFNPLDYVPNPSFNIHLKDIIAYGAGDDNITTHFSHNIIIENAYVPYTGGTEVPTNSNGIEIDDGCYDVTIIGGYIKNCRRGLEIKGHSWAPASKRVKVYGLTVENCVRNFGIRHLGFDNTDSKTAFDISLYDCTSIAPVSSTFTADTPRSLQISNYDGVYIKDFRVIGEHNTGRAVTIQERARNVKIDGMTFTQISGAITGITDALLYVDNTTQRNVTLQNLIFRDCVGLPIYITGSIPGIVIDGVDAFTTISPRVSSVVDFTWAPTTVPYTVRNVSVSGYNYVHTLGGSHNFDYTLPSNVGLVENIVPSSPATANTQYTVAKFGWREGTGQSLNAGVGVRVDFTSNIFSGVSAGLDVPVAYIGTRKVNGTDSDVTSNLTFGTLSANNASLQDRMSITPTGLVGINTTTPNERLTVVGNISATGNISTQGQILSAGVNITTLFGAGGGNSAVNTIVQTNSATWINTSTIVQTNSSYWNSKADEEFVVAMSIGLS